MPLHKIWHRLTTTRYVRTLEADLALERAVIARLDAAIAEQGIEIAKQDAEIARLRAENRALLNSILGIAGVPPLPATEADLAAVQSSLRAASISSVGARHAVPERATSTHVPSVHNRATAGSASPAAALANGTIQPSSIAGHGSAVPLVTDTPAADFRTAGVSPAPLPLVAKQARGAPVANHSRSRANQTQHVAAPTRRRSWPQIHRLLEFESAQKEKPASDPLPPAHH